MKVKKMFTIFFVIFLAVSLLVAQKETPPPGGTPKDFKLPAKHSFELDNGMNVTMVQYGTLPTLQARLIIRTGNIDEKEDEVWLADMTTDFLKEGTTSRSATDIAEQAAELGGSINVSTGPDRSNINGTALAEFAPQLIGLISDVVMHPKFPESELERIQNNYLRNLSVQQAQPQSIAVENFRKLLYPNHPYGRIFPTEEMINNFSIDKIKSFYDKYYGAKRSHLYIVGVFDESAVETAVRENLSGWTAGNDLQENIPQPETQQLIKLIDRPEAPQSTIIMGLPVIDPSHDDYIALQVTNSLLGGSFASRITSNIREDKGYTYSPFASISTRYRDSYWAEQADVTTQYTGASLKEIFFEIDHLKEEKPSVEELKGIQNYMAGIFVLRNSSPSGIINQLAFQEFHGLPADYLNNYVQNIYKVTPEEVQRIMNEIIKADKMTIVIVGDAKKIEQQVKPYGKVVF